MKKIVADKTEDIAEIIDRILKEPDNELTLVVPKSSSLGKSVRSFSLLKREMDAADKSVVVESVDETILAFAKQAGIEASHPLWKSVRGTGRFFGYRAEERGCARGGRGFANGKSRLVRGGLTMLGAGQTEDTRGGYRRDFFVF